MSMLVARLVSLVNRDTQAGQGLAEYALILALIAMIAIAGLLVMGNALGDQLSLIGGAVEAAAP